MSSVRAASLLLLLTACTGAPTESSRADGDAPIRTDRAEYRLRSAGPAVEVEIPFTYTNETGRTVALVNCNGAYGVALEKEVGGEWVRAWSPAIPLCLSPPIEIAPGESRADTLEVFAGEPSSRMHPQFEVAEIEGRYRLVIHNVVHDYDPDRQGFGDPVPLESRVSNAFVLRPPGG